MLEIQKIVADNVGQARELERVETGPVQFNDDWPGVFIRGDNAGPAAMHLKMVLSEAVKCVEFRKNVGLVHFMLAASSIDLLSSASTFDLPRSREDTKTLAYKQYRIHE